MANPNVGHIFCPLSQTLSVVRADCRGKLYYFSNAGKITPNLPLGQAWIRENAVLWESANTPPAGFNVVEIVKGAPPVIEQVKALTPKVEEKRNDKPLTVEIHKEAANDEAPKKEKNEPSWLGVLTGE